MKKTSLKPAALVAMLFISSSVFSQDYGPGGGIDAGANSVPCKNPASTWYLGGNQLTSVPSPFTCLTCPPPVILQNNIGTCNDYPFILKANDFQSVWVTQSGKIGINTSTPRAALDVREPSQPSGSASNFRIYGDANGNLESTTDINMNFNQGNNFFINEGAANSAANRMTILSGGEVGIGTSGGGNKVTIDASSNGYTGNGLDVISNSTGYAFAVHNSGGGIHAIWNDGRVAIGNTNSPDLAKLNINVTSNSNTSLDNAIDVWNITTNKQEFRVKSTGFVYAREINVQLTAFPDYVFKKDYKLMSLDKLDAYIKANKHLPNVPSESEITKNGANLGELNKIQMEKIEELTLYVIALKKELDELRKSK